mmetsp:Transcript_2416/g.4756  ORF Transcript_2416/g.4756 Transcript_2416/m.4756 type:complete len:621 (+) Transcript_2416:178-2040(+)
MFGDHGALSPGSLEWFVKFRNPFGLHGQLAMEPTFLSNELEFYLLAILTYAHAYRHGGRYMWLWWTTIAHGLTTECVSYWTEPIDNFWHSQSTFMFFGQREPLHIMCLYPGFVYTACVAVHRLGISELTSACAVGLFVVIFDAPYDIMGIKLLWWTWHDTDANVRDRFYWVPWTSFYFHATFASAFDFIYNKTRRYFVGLSGLYSKDEIQRMPYAQQRLTANWWGEFKALLVTGLFSMPFGICQFVPGYHWFKDIFNVHAEVTTCILGAIYMLVLFYGIQHGRPVNIKEQGEREIMRGDKKAGYGRWYLDEVYLAMCMHFAHYCILVVFTNPGTKQVLGLHQPMGSPPGSGDMYDCAQFRNLSYPYPFTPHAFPGLKGDIYEVSVWKRPYICPGGEMLDERYMDFTCPEALRQDWVPGNQWYWICGTDWEDGSGPTHVEYILVVWAICIFGFNLYTQAMCYPRNVFEQFFQLKEFPKYYKTSAPTNLITSIQDSRVNEETGFQEFQVTKVSLVKGQTETTWEERHRLVQDGAGQVYAERGALYGTLFDTYGGSTRDRLRTYDGHQHALERIKLFQKLNKRAAVKGISYDSAVPKVAGGRSRTIESRKTNRVRRRSRTPTR